MRVTIVILYSNCPCLLKMSSVVFACDVQHLKNRKIRVDIAGQQQQGKNHHSVSSNVSGDASLLHNYFFVDVLLVVSNCSFPSCNDAFFPAAVPASYNIPILSSKLALRGKLFSLEQASNVEVFIVSEVYPRLRHCLFKQKPFCY